MIVALAHLIVTRRVVSSNLALVATVHLKEPSVGTARFIDHILTVRVIVSTLIASTFITLKLLARALAQLKAECETFPEHAFSIHRSMKEILVHL